MEGSLPHFRTRLLAWFDAHRRHLPWRKLAANATAPDPYHVLVSELMLQQTQVATVIPYFERFIDRFPTLRSLADADIDDVLRLWQGLGYYSRARNLQRAAQTALTNFGGQLPATVDDLLTLPGVGRYTAGAIASIAFGRRAPILDGNVTRVLCRLNAITADPRGRATLEILWARAAEILPRSRTGDFNSALMELGALICSPRGPQCLLCPVRQHCAAQAAGIQETIPPPKKSEPTPLFHRRAFCIQHGERYLIEQRPPTGRWAGLWQFVTLETNPMISRAQSASQLPLPVMNFRYLATITHGLTHRRYSFEAFAGATSHPEIWLTPNRRWVTLTELDAHALSRPMLKIAEHLRTRAAIQIDP